MARRQKPTPKRPKRRTLKPKTDNQARYIQQMSESDLTFCSGPAGSGKTNVAVGLACQYLLEQKIERIIITRPVVETGRGLGHLPGTLIEKINPYLIPILEEMNLYLTKMAVDSYISNDVIELCPLEYMRGRNFHNCFMILDEAQNATFEQIKMFITRIGRRSKAVINGDLHQSDLRDNTVGGLRRCMESLDNLEGVSICELDYCDIVRSDIISKILLRLKEA